MVCFSDNEQCKCCYSELEGCPEQVSVQKAVSNNSSSNLSLFPKLNHIQMEAEKLTAYWQQFLSHSMLSGWKLRNKTLICNVCVGL